MDTLIHVILAGMAVGYITELLGTILDSWVDSSLVKLWTTLPLSAGALYLFGHFDLTLITLAPAAGFFALVMMKVVNRPVILQNVAQRVR